MTLDQLQSVLLWCLGIHYAILLSWFAVFVFAHDRLYRLHARWFRISVEAFDNAHYLGMAIYKVGVMLLVLVPLRALLAIGNRSS